MQRLTDAQAESAGKDDSFHGFFLRGLRLSRRQSLLCPLPMRSLTVRNAARSASTHRACADLATRCNAEIAMVMIFLDGMPPAAPPDERANSPP